MPSLLHETLVDLFRRNAELAPRLVGDRVELPAYREARVEDPQIVDLVARGFAADGVIVLVDEAPVRGFVIEVQLERDPTQRYTWPFYAAAFYATYRCPFHLVVVTPSAGIARWARAPIELGPGSVFTATVLGPAEVPMPDDGDSVEHWVLAAIARGRGRGGAELVLAALERTGALDHSTAALYGDVITTAVGAAVTAEVAKMVQRQRREYQSPFVRKYVDEGREEGLEKGREEGRLAALKSALVSVCSARGTELTGEQHARVEATTDPELLERWLHRAASDTDDIFQPEG